MANGAENLNLSYCLRSFRDTIRWQFRTNFASHWELNSIITAEEGWEKFEAVRAMRESLERLFNEDSWLFDCPICAEHEGLVAQLDVETLGQCELRIRRFTCSACGFHANEEEPFLAHELFQSELERARTEIFRQYGLAQ